MPQGPVPPVRHHCRRSIRTSLFTALQEQLGLKLESTRAPQQVLVIDRVERRQINRALSSVF